MSDSRDGIDSSSVDGFEDDPRCESSGQSQSGGPQDQVSPTPDSTTPSSSQTVKPAMPMQKRRRVTRACDECRRKKIKCDGKQPCTHCTVYSYECTFDQPSNRRRNPAPQYIEALEARLERAEALLRTVLPDVSLDDTSLDVGMTYRTQSQFKREPCENIRISSIAPLATTQDGQDRGSESMLESMVDTTGTLDLDDEGHWDFHGTSSGIVFLRCLQDQFGDLMGKAEGYGMPFLKSRKFSSPINSPKSEGSFGTPTDAMLPNKEDLPPRECAALLCQNALDDACALLRFVHQPTFWARFDRAYNVPSDRYGHDETHFLPLLYSVLAVGALFAKSEHSQLQKWGYENAIGQGFEWFNASRTMIDITNCRDLTSLQTVLFMIMFLQSSSRLSTCYSHIGIVLRSCLRMGLHRSVSFKFNPIECQIRKRIFWAVRKMDIYVGALLGLPMFLNDDDIDQAVPLEIDDEFITSEKILPMPPGRLSLMTAFNAHTRLVDILLKIVRYIYPTKGVGNRQGQSYVVSHGKVREIEQDLQQWMEGLPMALRPGGEAPPELSRIQQLLRMAYAHTQMFLYRPFLHYISQRVQSKFIDKRSYACAAACVSVSRNIIHISAEMKKRGLLNGSYWFYMYTTFFAILTLVFFILENPSSPTVKDILRDALEGKDTLAGLANRSMAADKCTQNLANLFRQLPEKLKGAKTIQPSQKKRSASKIEVQEPAKPAQSVANPPKVLLEPVSETPTALRQIEQIPPSPAVQAFNMSPSQDESLAQRQQAAVAGAAVSDCPTLQDSFSPNSAEQSKAESSSRTPTTDAWSASGTNQPLSAGLPDLGTVMFPTTDPLAYPNQPLSILEDHNFSTQGDLLAQNIYNAGTAPNTTGGVYEPMDAQLFGPMPPYLMQGQQSGLDFQPVGSSMSINPTFAGSNVLALGGNEDGWSMQHMQPSEPVATSNLNHGSMFGENWGQWLRSGMDPEFSQ